MAHIAITRVITESVSLKPRSDSTLSFGQAIDAYLCEQAQQGNRIQDVELHFEPQEWHEIADGIRSDTYYNNVLADMKMQRERDQYEPADAPRKKHRVS